MFNKFIAAILPYFPQKFVWIFSKAYIAGEKLENAIKMSKELNAQGYMVTIDVLGEFIENVEEAEANKHEYMEVIETAQANGIDGNYSVKPTSFGLLIDKEVAYKHIREIVAKAASYDNFVRIDMEDSPCTDLEIELYRKIKTEFPNNVGLVLQAYMRRTYKDIEDLMDATPVNYRLCKGIYVEPKEIAFKDYDEVNENFLKDLELLLKSGSYPGIATHDKYLIEESYKLLEKYGTKKEDYEFQMLYGVTPELRKSVIEKGHRLRVYVPFGKDWFGYSTRRLKENPKMANYIIKAIFHKG